MDINFNSLLTKKQDQIFITGTVLTLKPATVELIPSDTALPIVYTNGLKGMKVGSRLLLTKYQNRFIALAVIDSPNVIQDAIELTRGSTQTVTNTTETKVLFSSALNTVGTRLTYDAANYGVKIETGVKIVEVHTKLWLECVVGAYCSIYIYKNSTPQTYNISPARLTGQEPWRTLNATTLIPVTTNDLVYTYVRWSASNATENIIAGAYANSCNLTVKVVELDL